MSESAGEVQEAIITLISLPEYKIEIILPVFSITFKIIKINKYRREQAYDQ